MASANHNEGLYLRLLARFAVAERDFGAECTALVASGQVAEAIRRAHDLRSTAGTLGAAEVASAAWALEAAIQMGRSGAQVEGLVGNVTAALAPLLSELSRAKLS